MPGSTYMLRSVWRYPVKSMAGEELEEARVGERGLEGDRAYALMDRASGRVGSAKLVQRFGDLLRGRAELAGDGVRLTLADGRVVDSRDESTAQVLADAFGPDTVLVSAAPEGLKLAFAAGTLGGSHAETTEIPIAGAAPAGSLFDYACIHIVTTASLRRLHDGYPSGNFAVERFRPNFVVDCGDADRFVENEWVGRAVAIGPELVVRVSIPCPRCVMTTLPRAELPLDSGILRTANRLNRLDLGEYGRLPCVGVYADVVRPGTVRRGDTVKVRAS
ncbi:MAG: MOSC domain-containing protein [Acidobacteria bacterium]|nr:MOSC domain-containing protein [Acidobacteriota bacterium]